MQLRDECQKIRVHASLSGAHMIFPQEHGLAIRIYYSNDDSIIETIHDDNSEDIDGILEFCHKFQWSSVIFVVSDPAVLNDMDSFVQRAMQLIDHPVPPGKAPPRFIVVSNTEQAILAIKECAETIAPERCELRAKFIDKIRTANFCPKEAGDMNGSSTTIASGPEEEYAYDVAAAQHVQMALREWGHRNGLPDGESDVLLRAIPNLGQLVSVNDDALGMIPVDGSTKQKWRQFLSSPDNCQVDLGTSTNDNTIPQTYAESSVVISPPSRSIYAAAENLHTIGTMYETAIPMTTEHFDNGNGMPSGFPSPLYPPNPHIQNTYDAPYISNNIQAHHFENNHSIMEAFVTPEQYTTMHYHPEPPYLIPSHMLQGPQMMQPMFPNPKYQASALPWGQSAVRSTLSPPQSRPLLYHTNDSMRSMPTPGPPGGYVPVYPSQQVHWPTPVPKQSALAAATPYGIRANLYPPENDSKYMMRKFM
jgi:hypothetical protein